MRGVVCPGSLDAIQGALGTVCEAVDTVLDDSVTSDTGRISQAFVAIRPPGHHCGEVCVLVMSYSDANADKR